jgi:dynein heavy chain
MLDTHADIPWPALRYVIGDITYGGRVTDDWDRITLKTVLNKYLYEEALENNFKMSESGIYINPPTGSLNYYRDLIKNFPEYENPEVFGMHDNANITF